MARQRQRASADDRWPEDEYLDWRKLAEAASFPGPDDPLASVYPEVFRLVSPKLIQSGTEVAPKQLLRDPYCGLRWSPGSGSWEFSVTDRVLNLRLVFVITDLTKLWETVEGQLKAKSCRVLERKRR